MFLPIKLAKDEAVLLIRIALNKNFCIPAGITPVTLMPSDFVPALPTWFCLHITSHHIPTVSHRSPVCSAQVPRSPGLPVHQCSLAPGRLMPDSTIFSDIQPFLAYSRGTVECWIGWTCTFFSCLHCIYLFRAGFGLLALCLLACQGVGCRHWGIPDDGTGSQVSFLLSGQAGGSSDWPLGRCWFYTV